MVKAREIALIPIFIKELPPFHRYTFPGTQEI